MLLGVQRGVHIQNIIARGNRIAAAPYSLPYPRPYCAPRESSMVFTVWKMIYVSRLNDMFLM